jgi:Flp pilus assembly protein TadG
MRIFNEQKGVAIVEFALVVPLLLMLIFGMIEFSLLFYNKAMLTNACREGARQGIVFRADVNGDRDPVTDAEIRNVVLAYCQDYMVNFGPASLTAGDITVNRPSGAAPGQPLEVAATYHYDFMVMPGFIAALAGGLDIPARTIMRIE